jgi:glutamate synthase (NADPH/NADH) large chain
MTTTPLYDPRFEHDGCGVGLVADLRQRWSHRTVTDALTILESLEHRGATGSDAASGDGAGILLKMPDGFLRAVGASIGISLPPVGAYGVGVWFLPDVDNTSSLRSQVDAIFAQCGLVSLAWRRVPTSNSELGASALASEPQQWMQFVTGAANETDLFLERRLFIARRRTSRALDLYAASCSSRTLIYKGMLTSTQLRHYFDDLRDVRLETTIALVHSRFSTNTFPSWPLSQPFRLIAHNGEINTIRSNRNWMAARESLLDSSIFDLPTNDFGPVITPDLSDSGSFDEVAELLHLGGRSLPHAILMMIPEAWERSTDMLPARRDFYRYHSALMEAWDGPASVSFCDGSLVGAVLDRNGLRPARFYVTSDDRVILASEVGVLPVAEIDVVRKGRLQPGKMFLVDTVAGRIVEDDEIKAGLAAAAPYGAWLDAGQRLLDELPARTMLVPEHHGVVQHQRLFGYSDEDLRLILMPMARNGEEPVGSMGSDTALPALSSHDHSLFDYFTQQFAQVTNPPLDAIREELVTAVRVAIGPQHDLLSESPAHCRQIVLSSPVVSLEELSKLRYIDEIDGLEGFRSVAVDGLFAVTGDLEPGRALVAGLDDLEERVMTAVRDGANIVILSDRNASTTHVPLPSLLATATVHNRLVQEKWRARVALVVEAADAREVHHVALLLGFGASAVSPYLAYDSIDDLVRRGEIDDLSSDQARYRYSKALTKGVLKTMSKMGVSTVASYVGSQLFEAVGVADEVLERCFPDVVSRVGGRTFDGFARDAIARHRAAYGDAGDEDAFLANKGEYQWRRNGEEHLFNPRTVFKLQHATRSKRMDIFRQYTSLVNEQAHNAVTLRSLLTLQPAGRPVPLDEVESVESLYRRFSTGAMSYGSISAEAHETLAIAMNRLGGKSNTGEGGEDADRFDTSDPQNNRRSAIKQVASSRFGVTAEYLVNATDLQIKISQGAKPGEGGQLPGFKVYEWIARTRHSTPGVALISPPPHHDIYSIEDLAQLIYDLKCANNEARIHVKLVSEAGVGTVAAGVAKAHADVILISGHDGGTGAAPLTSLKHAGTPWEIGLAETQQTLAANGLRDRVVVQVDGQMKSGRDIVVAALLGAEEFGFATAPLVVSGCVMMRVCHLDTCPVGIATQNPELRKRFSGQPEFVENFFEFIATEVREILASLGLRSIDEAVGRTDLLGIDESRIPSSSAFHLDRLLASPVAGQMRHTTSQQHGLDTALDWVFMADAVATALEGGVYEYRGVIHNTDRTTGTLTGSELTRRLRGATLDDDRVTLRFTGSAGQSLGAFLPHGVTIVLDGDANDYVGKGLSGGRIIVRAAPDARFESATNVIAGNVIAYGATAGELFLNGVVGERLGVRNSGATIVAEGAGDHACEYMTGGTVVILGPVGRNVAAGMSGGTAYLYDPTHTLSGRLSAGEFDLDLLEYDDDEFLRHLLTRYEDATHSTLAGKLLASWTQTRMEFVKIQSSEYRRALDQAQPQAVRG